MQADHQIQTMADGRSERSVPQVKTIAANSATTTTQDFLSSLSPEVYQSLSSEHLQSLEKELQADLQAIIYSRLLWFYQSAQLELEAQQRQQRPKTAESCLLPSLDLDSATLPIVSNAEQLNFAEPEITKPSLISNNTGPELLNQPRKSDAKPRRRRRSNVMAE